MPQSRPQKSGHLASRKSGPLSSEKLILLSLGRGGARSHFQRRSFADSGICEFSLKHAKSRATFVRRGEKARERKEMGERGGRGRGEGERKGELRESRKTERRNSRRPGKMCIVCTHEGNYSLPSPPLFPLPSLVLSLFFPFREEKEGAKKEREREGEKGRTKFRIFADVSP